MDNPTGFTIFAVPKPFEDTHIAMLQNNAIQSWALLGPEVEVILCGNDAGVAEAAVRFGCLHIPDVECVESGHPLLSDVVTRAQHLASNDVVVYISADIILLPDFAESVANVAGHFAGKQFVMIGTRWDWGKPIELDFVDNWATRVADLAKKQGVRHSNYGMDYFVFRRGIFDNMKPFIIGWYAWDNALVLDVVRRKIPLVDASRDTFVIHQKHPERIRDRGKRGSAWQRLRNLDLAGGLDKLRVGGGGNVNRSNWQLHNGKLSKKGSR